MDEIIKECHDYVSFWEKMPQVLNNGNEFSLDVDFDPRSGKFKVNHFQEKIRGDWTMPSEEYPEEIHDYILEGCKNVQEYLEAKEIDQREPESYDDYILDRWGDCDYKGDSYE